SVTVRPYGGRASWRENDLMTSEQPVLVDIRDQRMHITLNRPEALNAQNQAMREAIVEAFDQLESDDDLRVAILSGAGRAFSAGADIKEMADRPRASLTE